MDAICYWTKIVILAKYQLEIKLSLNLMSLIISFPTYHDSLGYIQIEKSLSLPCPSSPYTYLIIGIMVGER
jgi:hypothetical protein